jgi:hypothetical protein
LANKNTLKQEDVINKANHIHNYVYDYTKFIYKSAHIKSIIICKIHGEFLQKPTVHINRKCGCPKCGGVLTTEEFIIKSNIIHNNKYNYSKTIYLKGTINVIIICPIHGEFLQKPKNHIQSCGCTKCSSSKGELAIIKKLDELKIDYLIQYKFKDCCNLNTKRKLPFDFYLPELNICIEYDGIQHFKPSSKFGGLLEFEKIKIRDKIKTQYCIDNNIKLYRIRYDQKIDKELEWILII